MGPEPLIDRLRQAKESCDLHTDQLSQAVLLEFAESGRLEAHRRRVLEAGRERLQAILAACRDRLPPGSSWTRPEGGMNVWVRLPEPLDAAELLPRAQRKASPICRGGISRYRVRETGALRLSFAGLTPEQIRKGLAILGKIFSGEVDGSFRKLRARARHGLNWRTVVTNEFWRKAICFSLKARTFD